MSEVAESKDLKQKIIEAYQEYVLLNGQAPASVYAFCKNLQITEQEFYEYFTNFSQVATAFWVQLFTKNLNRLQHSEEYPDFSVREKLLTLYYSFFEDLKKHRSYALITFRSNFFSLKRESYDLKALKKEFKLWINQLVVEGQSRNEIASRSKISDQYDELFWYHFLFIIDYWQKDTSTGFENTDAAIEKSVNLAFDLIEKNALESAFDFGKFLFQNR